MKTFIIILFFLYSYINADTKIDNLDFKFKTILHSEEEYILDSKDSFSFTSLYAHLFLNYDFSEDIFFSFGAKHNDVITQSHYDNYSNFNIDQTIMSDFSINYDDGYFALNIGRQDVNFDWLFGSIDGALFMVGDDENYSLRLFWFNQYQHLQYNYYMNVEDINDKKGIYGAVAKTSIKDIELSLFDYYMQDLRNISGGHINYIYKNSSYNLSYSSAKALPLALYDYDEDFLNASFEVLIDQHYFELGFSKTGENGLLAILQMGNFMFGEFYLGNQVDRENAKNSFLKYIYAESRWRFEFIGGVSKYDNSFLRIENGMSSYEIDSYLKYNYSKNISFDIGAMYMDVDENDPLQNDQSFIMFNMVFDYENY